MIVKPKHDIPKKEILEYYETFKKNKNDYLIQAKQLLDLNDLTFSMEEIDRFGKIYQSSYVNPNKIGFTYDLFVEIFIAYYGEAFRHYFGGKWYYSIDKKDYSYGYPQIIEYGDESIGWMAICPITYALMIERGDEEKLSLYISRVIYKYEVNNLSHLITKFTKHE